MSRIETEKSDIFVNNLETFGMIAAAVRLNEHCLDMHLAKREKDIFMFHLNAKVLVYELIAARLFLDKKDARDRTLFQTAMCQTYQRYPNPQNGSLSELLTELEDARDQLIACIKTGQSSQISDALEQATDISIRLCQ